MFRTLLVVLGLLLAGCGDRIGHDHRHDHGPAVVPAAERSTAAAAAFTGPSETRGITVAAVGAVDLGGEFPELKGRQFRARVITLAPGAVVAVHEHRQRPGVAYVLEGEVVERRNDRAEPVVHRAGSAAFERTGVVHWWENRSDQPARALVVDIVPQ